MMHDGLVTDDIKRQVIGCLKQIVVKNSLNTNGDLKEPVLY